MNDTTQVPAFRRPLLTLGVIALLAAPVFAGDPSSPGPADTAGAAASPAAESAPADSRADEAIPLQVRRNLEDALRKKVADLLKEKNKEGIPYKRGAYSKNFRKVDDTTYQVLFHVDSADLGSMQTQRYMLTLKKNASNDTWNISEEKLQDTYQDAYRSIFGDKAFMRFDGFSFDREGLKVTAGKGTLFQTFRNGKVAGFVLFAPDLAYEYTPPFKLHQKLYTKLKKDHAAEVLFKPDHLSVTCDSATCEEILSSCFQTAADRTAQKGAAPVAIDQIDPGLKEEHDWAVNEDRKNREEDWFRGFRPADEPDNRHWRVDLLRGHPSMGTPGKGIALEYDNFDPREVSFFVFGLYKSYPFWEPAYAYYSEQTRASGANPTDLERRDDRVGRDYDLESLRGTVEMGIDDSELMTADVTFGLKAKRTIVRLPFFIIRLNPIRADRQEAKSPKIFVNSVADDKGRELTFVKLNAFGGLVILPEPVQAGTSITLRAQFQNRDAITKYNTSFSYVSRGGWLPFVRFGDMIHEFDLTVKVPASYTVLGIGKKISDEVKDGIRITRWGPDSAVDFPTVIYGDYIDYASKVQAKKADGEPIPVAVHMDKTAAGASFYQIWYDAAADKIQFKEITIPLKSMQTFADEAANALNLYREIFGVDYPYSKLDLVNDPEGGLYGQSPSSIVYLGQAGFMSQGTLGTMEGFGGGELTKFTKSLVAHEVAHQWWGSLIGNANQRNYWFVESLAEYSSALFLENVYGRDDYLEHVNDWRREILQTDMQVSVQDASELWGGDDFGAYRAALYSKGPYAFHIMRSIWGDEKFFAFLKMLAQELKGKEIVTRDIQRVAEKAFGGNMEWFFDEWLRGVGLPEFRFTYTTRATEDGKYLVEGNVEQRVLVGKKKDVLEGEYFRGVIPITMKGKDGKEFQVKLLVDGPKTPFKFKVPVAPQDVTFNKYGEALAYDVIKSSS